MKESALTMQQSGGIGSNFSTLRPKGAPVKRVGSDASWPSSPATGAGAESPLQATGGFCPKCHQPGLIKKEGCLGCKHCG